MEKKEIKHTPARFKAFEFLQVKGMTHDDIELYASAPELVEALKDIANVMPDDEGGISLTASNVRDILAIIAKAEGKA